MVNREGGERLLRIEGEANITIRPNGRTYRDGLPTMIPSQPPQTAPPGKRICEVCGLYTAQRVSRCEECQRENGDYSDIEGWHV